MTRAVIDTNNLASAVVTKHASPSLQIYLAILGGQITLVTSDAQLIELEEVLNRARLVKMHKKSTNEVHQLVGVLAKLSVVIPIESVSPISGDPDDDIILASAYAGHAEYIVSGDKRHILPLKHFHRIPIMSPRDFVDTVLSKL